MADDGDVRHRIWVGGFGPDSDIQPEEIERKFEKYGKILGVKCRSSPADTFAFVQFEDEQAVEDAITKMDGCGDLGPRVAVRRVTKPTRNAGGGGGGARPRGGRGRSDSRPPPRRGGGGRDRGRGRRDVSSYSSRGGSPPPRRGGHDRRIRSDSRAPPRRRRGGGGGRRGGRGRSPSFSFSPSPPPQRGGRRGGGGRGDRSRTPPPAREDGVVRMAGKVPVGRYKITVENLPEDMSWLELKDLGRDYGPSLTFVRTFRHDDVNCGMIEFKDMSHAERVVKELNNRRVQGSRDRLRAYHGEGKGHRDR